MQHEIVSKIETYQALLNGGIINKKEYDEFRHAVLSSFATQATGGPPAVASSSRAPPLSPTPRSEPAPHAHHGSDQEAHPAKKPRQSHVWGHIGTFATKLTAVAAIQGLEEQVQYLYSGKRSSVIYGCVSHRDCSRLYRARPHTVGEGNQWVVEAAGDHSQEPSCKLVKGVPSRFRISVDDLLQGGLQPKKVMNILRSKHQTNMPVFLEEKANARIIANRRRVLTRHACGPIKMVTIADLNEFTAGHQLPSTVEEVNNLGKKTLVVLKGGVFELSQSHGFSFSCVSLLENFLSAREAWGERIPLETDGTFKILYNAWPLITLGTHSIYYDNHHGKISHQFRPISYMICKEESQESYEFLFRTTVETIRFMFGYELIPSNCQADRADGIRNAFAAVWPEASWTTCWPHIAQKVCMDICTRTFIHTHTDTKGCFSGFCWVLCTCVYIPFYARHTPFTMDFNKHTLCAVNCSQTRTGSRTCSIPTSGMP
jgi:hypothetical protein